MGNAHYPVGKDFLLTYTHKIAKYKNITAIDMRDIRCLLKNKFHETHLFLLKAIFL